MVCQVGGAELMKVSMCPVEGLMWGSPWTRYLGGGQCQRGQIATFFLSLASPRKSPGSDPDIIIIIFLPNDYYLLSTVEVMFKAKVRIN